MRTVATKKINRRPRATTRGYILIEVIVSLVVFSIGMLSVMRTFSVAIHARTLAQDYTVATLLCQRLIDESRVMATQQGGPEKGRFGKRFAWVRKVAAERVPEEQQARPRRQNESRRGVPRTSEQRRRRSSNRQRNGDSRGASTLRTTTLLETTVEVSWTRRGARHAVTVQAKVPVNLDEGLRGNADAQRLHTDRDSRRDDDILRRNDRGLRRL